MDIAGPSPSQTLPPHLVCIFHSSVCSFGFATHLFQHELDMRSYPTAPVRQSSSSLLTLLQHTNSIFISCLQYDNTLPYQLRTLSILEQVYSMTNTLYEAVTLAQFYNEYRCLLPHLHTVSNIS